MRQDKQECPGEELYLAAPLPRGDVQRVKGVHGGGDDHDEHGHDAEE